MTDRRNFLKLSGASILAASLPAFADSIEQLPKRTVAGTDDSLSIIGLGNSQAFRTGDVETSRNLLDAYFSRGGNYIDVGGPSAPFVGGLAQEMGTSEQAFFGNYIDPADGATMRQQAKEIADAQGKSSLDLVHTRDLQGYRSEIDTYRALRDEGLTRYVGIARTGNAETQHAIAELVEADMVDFIQVNYSILEPNAAERLLPLAKDNGVGIAISRPFINGEYFRLIRGRELPEWAAEFDCATWAQFSLKFILSHPAVTCVLTETANLKHVLDNLGAGFGRLPDASMRARMAEHLRGLI